MGNIGIHARKEQRFIVQAQGSNPRLQAGRFHHRYVEPLQ
jgi:hypothetical protein